MGRALGRTILICVFLIGLFGPAEAKRVALVIGNSAYKHAAPLANPRNDAKAISAELEKLGFKVITGINLSRSRLEQKARDFALAARGAKVALFYYAGHGLQVNGQNYIAPIDAKLGDEADLAFETVRLEDILGQMERERRTNLVFLDACRDNPLARSLARSMGTRSASVGRGLARIESGIGTLIAFATQPGNVALDGDGANSPFTTSLLKHIKTPNLDVALLMRRVREEVMANTGDRQVPWTNSSLTGNFSFLQKPEGGPSRPVPVSKQDNSQVKELQDKLKELEKRLETQVETPRQTPQKDKPEKRTTAFVPQKIAYEPRRGRSYLRCYDPDRKIVYSHSPYGMSDCGGKAYRISEQDFARYRDQR